MNRQEECGDPCEVRRIWINQTERIASFHEVDGYRPQAVRGQENYIALLQSLQEQGFRFQ